MSVQYPNTMYKGVKNESFIDRHGELTTALFTFNNTSSDRTDNFTEESITWNDCTRALDIIMNQIDKRTQEVQFKVGVAILSRIKLDEIIKRFKNTLDYERDPTEDNPHHGNILLDRAAKEEKELRYRIASNIASCCNRIMPRDEYNRKDM